MDERNNYFIGIDFNDRAAMISYFQPGMREPETLSQIAGSEYYQIPAVLAKKPGQEQWYFGDDARKMKPYRDVITVEGLLQKAIGGEEIKVGEETWTGEELLTVFVGKLLGLTSALGEDTCLSHILITMEHVTAEAMDVFRKVITRIGFPEENFTMIDHKESFYYFALSQKENFWLHEVFLFEYDSSLIHYYELIHDRRTKPQTVLIHESRRTALHGNQDMEFQHLLQGAFENRMVSTVYLVGDGFDGGWMKNSLNFLCKGKRAFIGKNLFSKGACYGAAAVHGEDPWGFVYFGENIVKFNVSLKAIKGTKEEYISLIEAGKNWYDTQGSCELILAGSTQIDFIRQIPGERKETTETLELKNLPERPERTTRLSIEAKAISDTKVAITVRDMGFGEFFRSSGMVWTCTMSM